MVGHSILAGLGVVLAILSGLAIRNRELLAEKAKKINWRSRYSKGTIGPKEIVFEASVGLFVAFIVLTYAASFLIRNGQS